MPAELVELRRAVPLEPLDGHRNHGDRRPAPGQGGLICCSSAKVRGFAPVNV